MKQNIFSYLVLALVLSLSSCSDWLEETNPNMLDKDSYWQNLNETNSTLSSAYAALVSDFALNIREEGPRADLCTPGFGRPTYSGDGADWYTHNYTSSTTGIQKKWDILYNGIFRANQVIEALQNLENISSQEEWTIQMAQARFLRGMYHFYLHSTYNEGKIIIADKVAGEYEEMLKSLSASEDVIEFFRKDLSFAYNNLPEQYSDIEDTGRATKGAAATLLGNSFLFEATLNHVGNVDMVLVDSARVMYESVVNSNQYQLVTDMDKLFTTAGEYNNESIFEIAFSNTINPESGAWSEDRLTNHLAFYYDGKGSNQNNIFPSLWVTYAYLTEAKDMLDPRNTLEVVNAETNETTSVERPVTMRSSAMIALVQDEYTPYYGALAHEQIGFPENELRGQNGFSRFKIYNNHDILEDESDLPGGKQNSGKNITLNRLAEVYLNLAECYIYKGEVSEALRYINLIRRRWALVNIGTSNGDQAHTYDEVTYDAASLLARLQNVEKPLETSIEGHAIRWFDLRRWGMLETVFANHAQETWYSANHFVTQGSEAKNTNKLKLFCTITDTQDSEDPDAIVLKDYEQAAINFNYEDNAWYPIPSTEVLANPNL